MNFMFVDLTKSDKCKIPYILKMFSQHHHNYILKHLKLRLLLKLAAKMSSKIYKIPLFP